MTCCGAGGGGGGVWGGKVEKRGRGKVVVVREGWRGGGEVGGVRTSCIVDVTKLTPHSPDQSRQVDRRDEPAPRREEETHR